MSDQAVTEPTASEPTASGPAPGARRRRALSTPARRALVLVLLLGGLGGLVATVMAASTGEDSTSDTAPAFVDRLIPASGSEVLRQATVGVDLATGYDAVLVINGVEVRSTEDGLIRDPGSGLIQFTPGPGRPVESLQPERNCVTALVWKVTEGEGAAVPVSWCFDAS